MAGGVLRSRTTTTTRFRRGWSTGSSRPPTPTPDTPGSRALQEPVPLSQSILWQLNDAYYHRHGVDAWASGDVPYQSTTSAVLGVALAALVAAFVEDCVAGRFGPFDPDEPVYVVDLGAGSGRLGWHFLQGLQKLRRHDTSPARIVYVFSDMVEANVAYCAGHPRLQGPFADAALYEAGSDGPIRLLRSGSVLAPGTVANPIVGLASYLFCVIPQELYVNVDGRLEPVLVGAELAELADATGAAPGSPEYLRAIRLRPVRAGAARAPASAAPPPLVAPGERALYPSAAVRSIDRLAAIGGERMLFLLAERAFVRPASATTAPDGGLYNPAALLGLGVHGSSLSMPVDVGLLAEVMARAGRTTLRPLAPPSRLELAAVIAGEPSAGAAASFRRQAVRTFDGTRPDDVFATVALAVSMAGASSLDEMVSFLRASELDPFVFRLLFKDLAREVPKEEGATLERAVATLVAIAERDYPIERDYELVYGVASLLTSAGRWQDALACLQSAVSAFGLRAEAGYNIAICHLQLDNLPAAQTVLDEVLALDPLHEGARCLRLQLP